MKKFFSALICVVMAFSLAACAGEQQGSQEGSAVQVQNPFVSCESLEAAAEITGFEMLVPDPLPDWVENTQIRVMESKMTEVVYSGGENELCIRKAAGSDDISGDYNTYEKTQEIAVNDWTVTVSGNEDKVNLATWTQDGYSFAVSAKNGLPQEEMTVLIGSMK